MARLLHLVTLALPFDVRGRYVVSKGLELPGVVPANIRKFGPRVARPMMSKAKLGAQLGCLALDLDGSGYKEFDRHFRGSQLGTDVVQPSSRTLSATACPVSV